MLSRDGYNNVQTKDPDVTYVIRKTGAEYKQELLPFILAAYQGESLIWEDDRIKPSGIWYLERFNDPLSPASWTAVGYSPDTQTFLLGAQGGQMLAIKYVNGAFSSATELVWSGANITSICWCPKLQLWIIVSGGGADDFIRIMPGDLAWSTQADYVPDGTWLSVCWSAELEKFVMVGVNHQDGIATSSDGSMWTLQPQSFPSGGASVCWNAENGIFAAVGFGDEERPSIIVSSNGEEWTAPATQHQENWNSVCYGPGIGFVAVASGGVDFPIMYSPDGGVWQRVAIDINCSLFSVCYNPEHDLFAAVGGGVSGGVVLTGQGTDWKLRHSPDGIITKSIAWGPEAGVYIGAGQGNTAGRIMVGG